MNWSGCSCAAAHRGPGTLAAKAEVRRHVELLDDDRPLDPDHNAMMAAVKDLVVLNPVEAEAGELQRSW